MAKIERLKGAHFDEGMAFLNEVFGEHAPHDFATLLPSIYRPTDEHMECNYAIRENGQIRAVVGLFPMTVRIGDSDLRVAGIGGVSTHRSVRGKGYMQTLMRHCVGLMQEQGFHLSYLGGQRQRYGYFGYEKCGAQPSITVSPTNLRHVYEDEPALRFETLTPRDDAWLDQARSWHDQRPIYRLRPAEDFYQFLLSWNCRPHVALDGDGVMRGYLVASKNGDSVPELLAADSATAVDVARAWVAQRGDQVTFNPAPTDCELVRRLAAIGEGVGLGTSGNWQVFAWEEVIRALLELKCQQTFLPDGRARFAIQDYGVLEVGVDAHQVEVTRTAGQTATAWDAATAMRLLFGPLAPAQVLALPPEAAALSAWCPLPLAWPRQDGV